MNDLKFVTVKEAAERLALSKAAAYRLVVEGKLPAIKVGRAVRIDAEGLARFIEACRVQPAA